MDRRHSKVSPISRTLVFVLLLLTVAPAFAQTDADKKQAQTLQLAGIRLMDHGDNRGALEKFEAAFRLFPSPKILFNMGTAHHSLGQDAEAVTAFERFLDEAPYAPKESRDEAAHLVESLHPKLSYLDLLTDDVGSRITVDGREVGVAPLPRPTVVAPGAHEVRFAKTGMTPETRSVTPVAGQRLRVFVKLAPESKGTPVVAAPPPAPARTAAFSVTPPLAQGTSPNPPSTPGAVPSPNGYPWQLKAAWISGGTGVLFLAGGVTAQLLSASKNSDFNNVNTAPSANGQCNKNLPNAGGGPCQGLLDSANSRFTVAIVGYVASGLALAGAVAFYLIAPPVPTPGSAPSVACLPSAESSGLSCALTMSF